MEYRPLRKDLTPNLKKCHFCGKRLTSLSAYILLEVETGKEVYTGPICAKQHITKGYELSKVPDLTLHTTYEKTATPGTEKKETKRSIPTSTEPSMSKRAIQYLILREVKLKDPMRTSYPVLKQYYEKYLESELTEEDIDHIINLEAKAPEKYKLANLIKCYNYLFWIDVALEGIPEEKAGFLKSIRSTLIFKGKISEQQIVAVNKWLENIKGIPQLINSC